MPLINSMNQAAHSELHSWVLQIFMIAGSNIDLMKEYAEKKYFLITILHELDMHIIFSWALAQVPQHKKEGSAIGGKEYSHW